MNILLYEFLKIDRVLFLGPGGREFESLRPDHFKY